MYEIIYWEVGVLKKWLNACERFLLHLYFNLFVTWGKHAEISSPSIFRVFICFCNSSWETENQLLNYKIVQFLSKKFVCVWKSKRILQDPSGGDGFLISPAWTRNYRVISYCYETKEISVPFVIQYFLSQNYFFQMIFRY